MHAPPRVESSPIPVHRSRYRANGPAQSSPRSRGRRNLMIRSREMYSVCAGLLLAGLASSCIDSAEPATDEAQADAESALAARNDDAFALTTQGLVRGTTTQTTREFRGIPHAAAPVGDLRWKPPQRAARHAGILDATRFANHCPQVAGFFGAASDTE